MENVATATDSWFSVLAAARARRMRGAAALLLITVSGACGLAWQMVWTAGFGVALGHELAAVLAVIGAFFGGLAAGAFMLAGRIERSARPGLWYAALEALVALWGLLVTLLLPSLAVPLARWLGPQPSEALHAAVAFGVPLALLLPATLAMGATLPALERQLRGAQPDVLPALYGANTAGALLGTLLAVFLAVPAFGLQATAWIAAGLNLACAIGALIAWGHAPLQPAALGEVTARGDARLVTRLVLTGWLGIAFEVLAVRVLSQVTENTIYTYALLLAVFLLGTAAGAALLRRRLPEPSDWPLLADRLLLALALAVLASGALLWWSDAIVQLPRRAFGAGLATALAGELLAGAAAMLPASLVMGALFSLLCLQARAAGLAMGRAVGLNTLGAAFAPAVVGAVLVPWLGAKGVLLVIGFGYLALASRASWQSPRPAFIAAGFLALGLLAAPLRFVDVPPGGRILSYREGALAAVSVVSDGDEVARLHINNRVQEGSSASGLMETRLAQLPLLLHPAPRSALFLGLGTGYTAHAGAIDPRVHVTAVELLPEVIDASSAFMLRASAPRAGQPVDVVAADARRFVQGSDARYDVIVADLFHPARNGAAALYTVEHFRAVRERLADGGLFCQWLALHQMDLDTLRSIVQSFLAVYPDGMAVLAGNSLDTPVIGLVARPGQPHWRLSAVEARLASPSDAMKNALAVARIDGAQAVLGSVIADAQALRRFAGDVPANTDDQPLVAHQAAQVDYAPEATPRERLAALLHTLPADAPAGVLEPGDAAASRLAAYGRARARYLALGMRMQPDPDPRVMLDRLGPSLLELVRQSPGFQPAAESLAALAKGIEADDYPLSQRVLAALRRAQSGEDQR